MALVFRDRELELGLYLANQGILVDSTLVCVWKEVNASVLKHVKTSFWTRKDLSNEQFLIVGECRPFDHSWECGALCEWGPTLK